MHAMIDLRPTSGTRWQQLRALASEASQAFLASLGQHDTQRMVGNLARQTRAAGGSFEKALARVVKALGPYAGNSEADWDDVQSLHASVVRAEQGQGFGDCVAFSIALAAVLEYHTGEAGEWVLAGNADNPGQHMLNRIRVDGRELLVDLTLTMDWWDTTIEADLDRAALLEPASGERLACLW